MNKILVTGAAGFIGFHFSKKLLDDGFNVIGIDNINDYYDINLKKSRLKKLLNNKNFIFKKIDIINKKHLKNLFNDLKPEYVVHLAAGVNYQKNNMNWHFL